MTDKIIAWGLLAFSILALMFSIYGLMWHTKLDCELTSGRSSNVDFGEYLLSGIAGYLATPGSIFCIVISILVIIKGQ